MGGRTASTGDRRSSMEAAMVSEEAKLVSRSKITHVPSNLLFVVFMIICANALGYYANGYFLHEGEISSQ